MEYSFTDTAKRSLKELDIEQVEEVLASVREVAEQGLTHEKVKMIKDRKGNWLYRLKIDREITNHRAFMEYSDGELEILDVMHRSVAYDDRYGNRD